MPAVVPPRGDRLRFWVLGLRLRPEYRPWVYERVTAPEYHPRRTRWIFGLQIPFLVIPQGLLALSSPSPLRFVLPAIALLTFGFVAIFARPLRVAQQYRLLAYHGLAPDGSSVPPVSPFVDNPLGRVGLALLCAQVLLVASGAAIVFERWDS